MDHRLIADPQTSGGLLVTVSADAQQAFESFMQERGFDLEAFGTLAEGTGVVVG